MKKLLLTISILLTFTLNAQTSVYHHFPDSAATWNIHYYLTCFGGGGGTNDEYYSITISGDTVISSKTYHKLTTPYVQIVSSSSCAGALTGYKVR